MSLYELFTVVPYGDKLYAKVFNKDGGSSEPAKQNKQSDGSTGSSSEEALPFETVMDNIIKIGPGKYRSIVRSNAINMEDMEMDDIGLILSKYADYNNGITKPYQIYIPSFSLDIRDNVEMLENRIMEEESDPIKAWLRDDIDFQSSLIEENDIVDTQFYIIHASDFRAVDQEKDFKKARKELSKSIKYASDELEGINLKLGQLGYEDIGKLLYFALNPYCAGKQEPVFDNEIITGEKTFRLPAVNKKGSADTDEQNFNFSYEETEHIKMGGASFKYKICPYSINDRESPEYVRLGSTYMTVYEIYDYPKKLPTLWAKKLYKYRENIDISIHIKPVPTSEVVKELNKAAIEYGSSLIDLKTGEKKKATTMIEKKMDSSSESISKTMDALDSGEESFFHFSMFVLVKGRSLEDLNDNCMEIENVLGSMRVMFRKCTDNMRNALWTVLPLGINVLGTIRDMLTSGVTNSFAFTNHSFTHKGLGKSFFFCVQKHNQTLIHLNPTFLINGHFGVLGISGSGKSNTAKKVIKGITSVLDIAFTGIDPQGEMGLKVYDHINHRDTSFAESIDATIYDYFNGSKHKFNVLEPEPDPEMDSLIKPHITFVRIFFKTIIPNLPETWETILNYSLIKLYTKFGFTDDKDSYWDDGRSERDKNIFYLGRPRRKAPELLDLYELLNSGEIEKDIGAENEVKDLALKILEFTRKGSMDLFDGPTTIDFKKKRKIFNLKHLDKEFKEAACFVLFQKIWDMKRMYHDVFELIYADELHYFVRKDSIAEHVLEVIKRLRMFAGLFGFSTQNITDLLKSKWAEEMIKNCGWTVLMKQAKADALILKDMYEMTRSEAVRMTMFNHAKGEAYMIVDNQRIPVNIKISEKERFTFTTNPLDLQRMARLRTEDIEKGLYVPN